MVRAALGQAKRVGGGPKRFARQIPAASVIVAILLNALPAVSTSGWFPDFGFLVLIAWRLLRSDAFPGWWAAPLGLVNDLVAGFPVGLSVFIWSTAILLLDLLDRRTMWRDYWVEWALAAVLLAISSWVHWRIDALMGADLPYAMVLPPLLISILTFPIAAWFVGMVDRWRLGR